MNRVKLLYLSPEKERLEEDKNRTKNWKRWGPYLSERQWGTVREDYSKNGDSWDYFPHEHARSRAYRWGEDGLMGLTDRECRLCFSFAFWNGKDPILKERFFGLTGPEGNHGEDCKELYYYLDATPTYSYLKGLYKYPQTEFPYKKLKEESAKRSLLANEFEILDSGIFDENKYFNITFEYCKALPNDILIELTIENMADEEAELTILPTLWYRNTWIWGCKHEGCSPKPLIFRDNDYQIESREQTLGTFMLALNEAYTDTKPEVLFTDNETNFPKLFKTETENKYFKDAFHEYIVEGKTESVNPKNFGTKSAFLCKLNFEAKQTKKLQLRLFSIDHANNEPFGQNFDELFEKRRKETDEFYLDLSPNCKDDDERNIQRQAYAGLLWSKQFYHYSVSDWLDGDANFIKPPTERLEGRNKNWRHLFNRDIISMPDKWEYPWYAAWDSAFHMIPFAKLDPEFAKEQLILFLREWYMHPNGQIPAYEFAFDDVNPPVHAWACWRVYKMSAQRGERDIGFLKRVFHKLLLNFTWWVNRKDPEGNNIFSGGFLGLDNIGVFERSNFQIPGTTLEQADATAWMAFFCSTMLSISLEIAHYDSTYEDVASKFFEHFITIVDSINNLGGVGLWDEQDGFYYDRVLFHGDSIPLRTRSLVGLLPLCAMEILDERKINKMKGFKKRMDWFLNHRKDLSKHISYYVCSETDKAVHLLAMPSKEKLIKVLQYMLNEEEFLSEYGIRSLSKFHEKHPFNLQLEGNHFCIQYLPGESDSKMFGGNSNWRGPIWFPLNYLLIESLEKYDYFYGDTLKVEFPTGSGKMLRLKEVADELSRRLIKIFKRDKEGNRPIFQDISDKYKTQKDFEDLILFHEYFHADKGSGLGASHQTGWTGLIAKIIEDINKPKV
jgi:hypothetical protein